MKRLEMIKEYMMQKITQKITCREKKENYNVEIDYKSYYVDYNDCTDYNDSTAYNSVYMNGVIYVGLLYILAYVLVNINLMFNEDYTL